MVSVGPFPCILLFHYFEILLWALPSRGTQKYKRASPAILGPGMKQSSLPRPPREAVSGRPGSASTERAVAKAGDIQVSLRDP